MFTPDLRNAKTEYVLPLDLLAGNNGNSKHRAYLSNTQYQGARGYDCKPIMARWYSVLNANILFFAVLYKFTPEYMLLFPELLLPLL